MVHSHQQPGTKTTHRVHKIYSLILSRAMRSTVNCVTILLLLSALVRVEAKRGERQRKKCKRRRCEAGGPGHGAAVERVLAGRGPRGRVSRRVQLRGGRRAAADLAALPPPLPQQARLRVAAARVGLPVRGGVRGPVHQAELPRPHLAASHPLRRRLPSLLL